MKPNAVNIAGINKAELLAALYNEASPLGMGFLHYTPEKMTTEQAQALIDDGHDDLMFRRHQRLYFDYVKGRPLKVDLSGDEMSTALYNRDQGQGSAERVVENLRRR